MGTKAKDPVYVGEPKALPPLHKATFEQWYQNVQNPKFTIMSFDPSIFDREDVMISVTLYAGMGGVGKGSIIQKDGKYCICALAIECDPEVCATHRLNNPSIPVLCMHMTTHKQVFKAVKEHLPKRH